MGKHIDLIRAVKNEVIDCKDNLVMTVQDYLCVRDEDEIDEQGASLSEMELLADELDDLGDLLYDLLSSNFNKWNIIVGLSKKKFSSNHTLFDALRTFETTIEEEKEEILDEQAITSN